MNLRTHLDVGTPLIWVNSDEPDRVIDIVSLTSTRPIFKVDPFNGFSTYVNGLWKKVLVELEGIEKGTFSFEVAFDYAIKNKGVFIIPNAHLLAEKLVDILGGLYSQYRNVYMKTNDVAELPLQLVMISCNAEIPPEILRNVAVTHIGLPSELDIANLSAHIQTSTKTANVLTEDLDLTKLGRAGIGLTESEFVQAAISSIIETKRLDPEFIARFKLSKLKEGGILEIRRPKLSLDDIGGMDNAKKIIKAAVWTWDNPDKAEEFKVIPIRRILMVGVPGTGKSALCEGTAKSLGLDLAKTGISSNMSKWIGESESNMRKTFQQIHAMAPLVCWMDELGRDLSGSGSSNDSGTTDRVHGEFLTGLQELPNNVFLMAAANRIDGIPPEMLRAGRFDKILFVGFPTHEERMDIFDIHLGERETVFDLDALSAATSSFTGAEIESLIKETRFNVSTQEQRHINGDDIIVNIATQRNRVWLKFRQEILAMYSRAITEWEWASSGQYEEAQLVLSGKYGAAQAASVKKKQFSSW